jgi:phage-related protein
MPWIVETLSSAVDAELAALPDDMIARFAHISSLMRDLGLERVRHPHVDHLQGPLWEMRLKGKAGIARALYVTASGQRVVVVRVCVKKTQRTPPAEIRLALQRSKEVK